MSASTPRQRLQSAALAFPLLPEDVATVRLGSLVPWWLLEVQGAYRASGSPAETLPMVANALGLGPLPGSDTAKAMQAMLPVPAGTAADQALLELPEANAGVTAATWQMARDARRGDARVRRMLVGQLGHMWDDAKFEALTGLLVHGAEPSTAPAVGRMLSSDNMGVIGVAAAVLVTHDLLDGLEASGALEDALGKGDHTEFAQQVVELARGDLSNLSELVGNGWEARVGLYMLLAALVAKGSVDNQELFDFLVGRVTDEDDSDAASALTWTLGLLANDLGSEAALAIIEAAKNCSDGSWTQGVTFLALLAVTLPKPAERAAVVEALDAIAIDDNDTNNAIALARAHVTGGGVPWLAATRWNGIRTCILNPWRPNTPFFRAMLAPVPAEVRADLLGAVTQDEFWEDSRRARLIGWVLANDPTAVGLLEELVRTRPEKAAGPVSAALMLHDGPVNVDPIVARMEIGAEAGGPLPDEPAVWGRLLRGMQESRVEESARALLRMCPTGAKVAEAWFRAGAALGSADEAGKALPFASSMPVRVPRAANAPLDRVAIGAKVPVSATMAAIATLGDVARADAVRRLFAGTGDRETLLALARGIDDANIDAETLIAVFWPLARHSSWIQREAAGALAQHIPTDALEEADDVKQRLVELCNDNDSDVQREAQAAAQRIALDWEVEQADDDEESTDEDEDLPF